METTWMQGNIMAKTLRKAVKIFDLCIDRFVSCYYILENLTLRNIRNQTGFISISSISHHTLIVLKQYLHFVLKCFKISPISTWVWTIYPNNITIFNCECNLVANSRTFKFVWITAWREWYRFRNDAICSIYTYETIIIRLC